MDSIIRFLKEDILPEERIEADKVRRKATRYWLSENQKLYKRSFLGPYLLCVHPELTESLLEELHEDERMQGYLSQVKCLQLEFDSFDLLHILRNGNAHADFLAMLATSLAQDLPRVILIEDLYKPTETV